MPKTGASKRIYRAAMAWVWDRLIEHWPQIIFIGGASVMAYLASITVWFKRFGPIGYGVVGIGAYLLFMVGYLIYGLARKHVASSRLADERWKAGSINPLEGNFSNQRIKLSDFFNPFYEPVKTAKFLDCELLGPSNIFLGGCNVFHSGFIGCQAVIIGEGKTVIGVTVFSNCIFERCKFFQVTLYMTKQQYISLKEQAGIGVPIISDGEAGNL